MKQTMDSPSRFAPSPVRQAVLRGMTRALPRRLFMTSGPPVARSLALTFDDGPDPVHTPAVLDRLHALGVRATFFVIGRKAEEQPALVARIVEEGHELGHHSYSHGPPGETSALRLLSEARRTSALLLRLVGRRPVLYRPPHGKLTPGKLLGLWGLGQTIVLWNRDPRDYASGSASSVRLWFEREPLSSGDIILLHDVHPHVVPALEALAERVQRLGLSFGTPTEWLDG